MKSYTAIMLFVFCGFVALAVYLRWEMASTRERLREDVRREIVESPAAITRDLTRAVQRTAETIGKPSTSDQRTTDARPGASTNAVTESFMGLLDVTTKLMRQVDRIGLDATRLTDEEESKVGQQIHRKILQETGVFNEAASKRRVQEIARPLIEQCRRKEIRYTLSVLDTTNVNAFSVAGGYVYVTRAFLKEYPSDAALALALGHEIGHVELRHCVEKIQYAVIGKELFGDIAAIAQLAYATLRSPYSKGQEFEADHFGFVAARKAGYPTRDLLGFLEDLQAFERKQAAEADVPLYIGQGKPDVVIDRMVDYFATHPSTTDRLKRLEDLAQKP